METIQNQNFEGERPLYARHGLRLENVVFGPGESALKEGADFEADSCEFKGCTGSALVFKGLQEVRLSRGGTQDVPTHPRCVCGEREVP